MIYITSIEFICKIKKKMRVWMFACKGFYFNLCINGLRIEMTVISSIIIKSANIIWYRVVMYGYKCCTIKKAEHWRMDAFKLWCWRRFLSPLDSKENKPVNSNGSQSWIFIGRIDAEAEAPVICPPDTKRWLIEKDFDAGKDWWQ